MVLYRTTVPISTKLGKKYLCVKGIRVCSNEVPTLFQGEMMGPGDDYQIAKILDKILKISSSWTTGPIL